MRKGMTLALLRFESHGTLCLGYPYVLRTRDNSTYKYYCTTFVIFEFHSFPIRHGGLDSSAYASYFVALVFSLPHYHLRLKLCFACF